MCWGNKLLHPWCHNFTLKFVHRKFFTKFLLNLFDPIWQNYTRMILGWPSYKVSICFSSYLHKCVTLSECKYLSCVPELSLWLCAARQWWSKPCHRLHVYASLHPRDGFPNAQQGVDEASLVTAYMYMLHYTLGMDFPMYSKTTVSTWMMIETFLHTAFQLYGIRQDKPMANYFLIITVKQEQAIFHYNNNIVMSWLCNIAFNNIKWSEVQSHDCDLNDIWYLIKSSWQF